MSNDKGTSAEILHEVMSVPLYLQVKEMIRTKFITEYWALFGVEWKPSIEAGNIDKGEVSRSLSSAFEVMWCGHRDLDYEHLGLEKRDKEAWIACGMRW